MFIVSLDQTNKLDNAKDKRERERTLHRQKNFWKNYTDMHM